MECTKYDFQKILESFCSSKNILKKETNKDIHLLLLKLEEIETLYVGKKFSKQKQ